MGLSPLRHLTVIGGMFFEVRHLAEAWMRLGSV